MPAPRPADGDAHPLGDLSRLARRALDDERELLAADAEDLVLGADDSQEDTAHLAQDVVPDDVSLLVVAPLNPSRSKRTSETGPSVGRVWVGSLSRCSSKARLLARPVSASRRASK